MKDSYFLGLLRRDSRLQAAFEKSLIFTFFALLGQKILGFFSKLYRKLHGQESLSFTYFLTPLLNNFHRILGVFILIVFITPHNLWQNTYGLLGALALAALFILKVITQKEIKFAAVPLPIILFGLAVCVGVLVSPNRGEGFRIALFYLTAILIAYVTICGITDRRKLRELLWFIWLGLMLTSLYAVYQGLTGVEVNLTYTDVENNLGMPGRVFSTFENPNNYAELIVMLFPFCMALAFTTRTKWLKWTLLASLVLPLGAVALTYCRSGWVALAGTILVFLLLYKPLLLVPIVVLGLVALPFLPQSILNRIGTIGSLSDNSNKYRTYIWEGALRIIKNYGWTGIGLGPVNFGLIYPTFAVQTAINARHSHMLYLQTIIEMGALGFVSVMWMVLGTMKNAWAAACKSWAKKLHRYTAFALIAAMCGMGFMAFAEYIWYYPRVLFTFFLCLGIGGAVINMVKNSVGEQYE